MVEMMVVLKVDYLVVPMVDLMDVLLAERLAGLLVDWMVAL